MTLHEYLCTSRMSVADLARAAGVSRNTANQWRNGTRIPRLTQILSITRITGGAVTVTDFASELAAQTEVVKVA